MAEQLGSLARTHTCGALRESDVGTDVTLLGWVHRVRDLGSLLFLDIRDREGVTQVVVNGEVLLPSAKRRPRSPLRYQRSPSSSTNFSLVSSSLCKYPRLTLAPPM